jgi:hypothetical protein
LIGPFIGETQMPDPDHPNPKTCPRCQTKFECGIAQGQETCWCFDCPRVLPVVENAACLCPECLRQEIIAKQLDTEGKGFVPSPLEGEG